LDKLHNYDADVTKLKYDIDTWKSAGTITISK
jgi:hypothetical protein